MGNAIKQLEELKKLGSSMRLAAEQWSSPWQTLIAIILSARSRDERTILVAHKLFKTYSTVKKLANANLEDVEKIIRPVNFYRTKSKSIINCAKMLIEKYNGGPPHDLNELLNLPGVGRKTANVFLSEMGEDAIGTDTHVLYIAGKLGWTKNDKPKYVEEDLKKIFPKNYWRKINPILVRFGKTYVSRKKQDGLLQKIKLL